jgi:hypothetical protein
MVESNRRRARRTSTPLDRHLRHREPWNIRCRWQSFGIVV